MSLVNPLIHLVGRVGIEAPLVFIRHHDGHGRVGLEDGHFLDHIVHRGRRQARGAHDDHGLGGEVDMLLVLQVVHGDCLVAELGQLDSNLFRGDPVVGGVADGVPLSAAWYQRAIERSVYRPESR